MSDQIDIMLKCFSHARKKYYAILRSSRSILIFELCVFCVTVTQTNKMLSAQQFARLHKKKPMWKSRIKNETGKTNKKSNTLIATIQTHTHKKCTHIHNKHPQWHRILQLLLPYDSCTRTLSSSRAARKASYSWTWMQTKRWTIMTCIRTSLSFELTAWVQRSSFNWTRT